MSPFVQSLPGGGAAWRRRFLVRRRPACGPLAVVPLVNVALLFWLFHVVNSSFVLKPGLRMELPAAPFAGGATRDAMVLTLTQEGLIFFNDERVPIAELPAALKRAAAKRDSPVLLIEADGRVRYQLLVDIYNFATEAGIREVTLATRLPDKGEAAP